MKRITMFLGAGILLLCSMAYAAVPQLINFQGVLRDGGGNPVADGSYSVVFTIYDAPSAGNVKWTETQSVNTTDGLFAVLLGSVTPVADFAFNDTTRWLGVKVGTDPEMTPRQRLTSAAYSFRTAHFIPGIVNTFIGQYAGNLTMTGVNNTASGAGALPSNTTGDFNTASGTAALYGNTTGSYNTASGTSALYGNTTGSDNTASGYSALFYNIYGSDNTASGYSALYYNVYGDRNTASGASALQDNYSGSYNTASGYQALYRNSDGSDNSASGAYALQNNYSGFLNTASGASALQNNYSGSYNTASGSNALYNNIGGDGNTASGYQALGYNSTGSSNTAVGKYALLYTSASDFNTAIGANAGYGFDNGYNNVFVGANTDVTGPGFYNVIAIGQATPVGASSTARFGNAATVSYGGWAGWSNVSDGRYKKNVRENVPGIEFIKKLRPITYNLDATGLDALYRKNDDPESPRTSPAKAVHERALREKEQIVYTGFVAQEVEAAARTLGFDFSGVDAAKNGNEVYGLRYAEFVVPLVKAVQELGEENAELKIRMEQLEKKLKELQAEVQ